MTTTERIHEIVSAMTSFPENYIHKSELQAELFKLQEELVTATFNGFHAENAKLRIWDVENHLRNLNEERGHIADEELDTFVEGCKVLSNVIRAEITGNAGEYKAARSLEIVRTKKQVLRNIEFKSDDRRTELDFIVFTEKAIFIIEVKNPQKDIYIDERGNYCRVSDTMHFDKNIGECMNNKMFLLRQVLCDAGYENPNIQSLLVFSNNNINVENHFEHINIAFLSSLPHIIEKCEGSVLYTDNDISKMVECVTAASCKEAYPLPFDVAKFKQDFAILIAKLEGYQIENEAVAELVDENLEEIITGKTTDANVKLAKKTSSCKKNSPFNMTIVATLGAIISVTGLVAGCIYHTVKR